MGAYSATARAHFQRRLLGEGKGRFLVESYSPELSPGAPRPDLLKAIAEVTGGSYAPLSPDALAEIDVVDADVVEVDRRRNYELWDNFWAMLLGVLLLGLDWSMRRRSGYL